MLGLGETTAILARRRRATTMTPSAPAAKPALVETAAFGGNPGALRMLSYAPLGLADKAPLVVVLHGCTQAAESYAVNSGWIALADRLGFAVLAPEQVAVNNPNRCFNWFEPGDTARGRGEAASIAAMVAAVIGNHNCDPRRVFVTGLSAGGAMTAAMLATYPELFAGGAIIAGMAYGVAHGVPDALRMMGRGAGRPAAALGGLVDRGDAAPLRLSIWQGDADYTVKAVNAQDLAHQWIFATGLSETSDEVARLGKRTQTVWSDGQSVVELNIVHGLGHGVPLATKAEGDIGRPAPYILEAGVSSTLEIATFWGLAKAQPPGQNGASISNAVPRVNEHKPGPAPSSGPGIADQVLGAVSEYVSPQVRDVIAKALRAAGLTR